MAGQLELLFSEVSELWSRLDSMSVRASEALVEEQALEEADAEARPLGEEYLVNLTGGKLQLPFVARDGVVVPGKSLFGWRYVELVADLATAAVDRL